MDSELHLAIRERLAGQVARNGGTAPVLAVTDGWQPELLADAVDTAAGAAVLPVQIELGSAVIGPLVLPGVPGCLECVATRRAAADPEGAADRAAVLQWHGTRLAGASAWLTAFAVQAVATIAAAEVIAVLAGERPRSHGALIVVELSRLTVDVHPFLPDPQCRACSDLPADDPESAVISLSPRPKLSPTNLRVTEPAGRADELRRTYVDRMVGVVSEVRDADACGLPVSCAPTGWRGSGRVETGIGRATDRVASGLAAVLEAVERRAGIAPSGKRTVQRASLADLAEHAIDPRRLGLLPPEVHAEPGSRYPRFDRNREMDWVWGYSFQRQAPVLVPRTYAYYGHTLAEHSELPLVYETSNGCALGTCLEEAALHGLLEVAGRDAFLLTWYARIPAPRIAINSASSPQLRLLAERIERTHGYRVLAFDTTVEQGIPAVAVLAVSRRDDPDRPAVLCAAAAHLDPERACWAALGELALVVEHLTRTYPQRRTHAAAMVADSNLVRAMEDHALLYCHRDTLPRWDFLLDEARDGGERSFAESFSARPSPAADLRDDLVELVRRYQACELDVVIVDQTGPEQRAANLAAVKAIVPGTLPITFGHRNRRVHGLPRLRTVPMLLGHRETVLADDDINPYPHPFP